MPAMRETCSSTYHPDASSRPAPSPNQRPNASLSQSRTAPKPSCSNAAPSRSKSAARKKKPANAFILFRSFVLQNNLLPPKIHQNDVSIEVARMWREATPEYRSQFFVQAELEKARRDNEGLPEGSGATISCSPQESLGLNTPSYVDHRMTHPAFGRRQANLEPSASFAYPQSSAAHWTPQVSTTPSRLGAPPAIFHKPDFSGANTPFVCISPALDPLEFDWSSDFVTSDISLHPDAFR